MAYRGNMTGSEPPWLKRLKGLFSGNKGGQVVGDRKRRRKSGDAGKPPDPEQLSFEEEYQYKKIPVNNNDGDITEIKKKK